MLSLRTGWNRNKSILMKQASADNHIAMKRKEERGWRKSRGKA
jgi:hypothetical protein